MIELDGVVIAERGCTFSVELSGVTALVGPNGAGKSTLLSLVAGSLRPSSGRVSIHGEEMAGPGVFVPAHRRGCAYLEQRALLFPHLNVLANAAFGASLERAHRELAAVGCSELATRRPRELSGGQAQRVAIARALAIDPRVVLLDEPLAALDVAVVPEIRQLLRERLSGRTALLVTHSLLDVITLAERVCVLGGGRIIEHGPVAEVCARPTSTFLADLVGTNLLSGVSTGDGIDMGDAGLVGMSDGLRAGAACLATVPPNAIGLYRDIPSGSPRNAVPVVVTGIEPRGGLVRVGLRLGGQPMSADVTAAAVADLNIMVGDHLVASIKATQVNIYLAPSSSVDLPGPTHQRGI